MYNTSYLFVNKKTIYKRLQTMIKVQSRAEAVTMKKGEGKREKINLSGATDTVLQAE